ncbi:MAG: cysteine desulfurase [Candidatus Kaiserbacteria bacterium]|nr:cysteine desulfurase [Candidatus Kaiserbacteria bacterium]
MKIFGRKRVYLDYASTTPASSESLRAMREAESIIGNPSSIHEEGVEASRSLESSRAKVARELGCKAREIIFTSGITESNNLAILGYARALERTVLKEARGPSSVNLPAFLENTHWIVSAIEHSSVLECFSDIERRGGKISYADPDSRGIILPETVEHLLRKETVFVSIGWANNETGVINPLASIARVIHGHEEKHGTRVIFHSDAGQAPLYLSPHAHALGADLFSLGASKIYGPHGAGCLYASNRAELAPIILGGGQERGLRGGTENVALSAGFATALEEAGKMRTGESKRLKKMRDDFAREIVAQIPGAVVNGNLEHALPHILNVSIPNINSEYLLLALDREGIALSAKSACNAGEKASHVVSALGGPVWRAENTLRFSLGRDTTVSDVRNAVSTLVKIVGKTPSL